MCPQHGPVAVRSAASRTYVASSSFRQSSNDSMANDWTAGCTGSAALGAAAIVVRGEVPFDRVEEHDLVLRVLEAVALVVGDEVLDGHAAGA